MPESVTDTPSSSPSREDANVSYILKTFPELAQGETDLETMITPEFRQALIERYKAFHNLENADRGTKVGHNSLTDAIYSRANLPVLVQIHDWALQSSHTEARDSSAAALYILHRALSVFEAYAQQSGTTASAAFAHMRFEALRGRMEYATFLNFMNCAKYAAHSCIATHVANIPPETQSLLPNNGHETFGTLAQRAQWEFSESEYGVSFDATDVEQRIADTNTQVLVISMDYNSTWNRDESYTNVGLIDNATAIMHVLASSFKKKFPAKKILLVLNTGRPAMYLWGGMETLPPIPEMRELCLAESGGVAMYMEGTQPHMEVAVASPRAWKVQLEGLKNHLLDQIREKQTVTVEPKESMLSIRIAQKAEAGGQLLHSTTKGEPVTPEWVQERVDEYLKATQDTLKQQFDALEDAIGEAPDVQKKITDLLARRGKNGRDSILDEKEDVLRELEDIFRDAVEHRIHELAEVTSAFQSIVTMRAKLVAQFNATAGYIDIGHRDLNKYSTLSRELARRWAITPDHAVIIHIGDSSTDILPTQQNGVGEVNEGVDDVLLVGVQNSSPALREAIAKRGNRGLITAHPSAVGLATFFLGLTRIIDQM